MNSGDHEAVNKSVQMMINLVEMKNKLQVVSILKVIRQFYQFLNNKHDDDNDNNDYAHFQLHSTMITSIVSSLLQQLFSEQLPWYSLKPVLKTLFLFRNFIPSTIGYRGYLANLATQTKNKEVAYWTTRILVIIAINAVKEEDQMNAIKVVMNVLQTLDISLSYRTMLADITLVISEVHHSINSEKWNDKNPAYFSLNALRVYTSLFLLRDSNPSLQQVAIQSLQERPSTIMKGVNSTEQNALQLLMQNETLAKAYCNLCRDVFVFFLEKNSPALLVEEEQEVRTMIYECEVCVFAHR